MNIYDLLQYVIDSGRRPHFSHHSHRTMAMSLCEQLRNLRRLVHSRIYYCQTVFFSQRIQGHMSIILHRD